MARPADLSAGQSPLAQAFAAAELAPLVAAITALDRELGALARPELEHRVAHAKLGWWQEETGRFADDTPRHPLTRELARHGVPGGAARPLLEARLAASARTLAGQVAADEAALEAELIATQGLVPGVLALALGASGARTARALALVEGLSDVVRGVRADARRGRLRLPLAPLDAAGIGAEDLTRAALPAAVTALQVALAGRAEAAWATALEGVALGHGHRLRSAYVQARLGLARLERAARAGFAETPAHPARAALRELVLAWRTARAVA